ncbi:MAG TPA: hypothetical protein PKE30_16505 [Niabella sp.]|nr:hypothetical protein [Niabella sp.]
MTLSEFLIAGNLDQLKALQDSKLLQSRSDGYFKYDLYRVCDFYISVKTGRKEGNVISIQYSEKMESPEVPA